MRLVFFGLSITSSWGNGHAVTYRALVRALAARGHDVLFVERDLPWYEDNRDLPRPPFCEVALYRSIDELHALAPRVERAHAVVVGSCVPDGKSIAAWALARARGVSAFYDLDAPVTFAALGGDECEYLSRELLPKFDLHLSFTGGPLLDELRAAGARDPRPLYCACDPELYAPSATEPRWALGYLGTYSEDRQPALERLLLEPARRHPELRFVVAGPQYPESIAWPRNVDRVFHLAPAEHRAFYNAQRFTLNVTRAHMARAGFSPSVRLFEAAACGATIVSDRWRGIDTFFEPGRELLIAEGSDDVERVLRLSDGERRAIGERARVRVLREHTAARRAETFERYVLGAAERKESESS